MRTDESFRLREYLRTRLNKAISQEYRGGSAVRDLGCSIAELKLHFERQFQPGMSWDNWGEWHIDHVLPLVSFDLADRSQLLKACHYTNLQPLWAIDNLRKNRFLPLRVRFENPAGAAQTSAVRKVI